MSRLVEIASEFLAKHGVQSTAVLINKNEAWVAKLNGGAVQPTVVDLQKMVDYDPSFIAASAPPYEWPDGQKVAIIMVSNRAPAIGVLKAFSVLFERDKMQFLQVETNMPPSRGRNAGAQQFLFNTRCEWSLWWDDDIVPPHGDVDYFRRTSGNPSFPPPFANINPIARLLQSGKTLVSGVYFGRRDGGRAQYASALASNVSDDVAHSGPRILVEPQSWTAFGFTLVHRQVFEDIMRTQPELEIKDAQLVERLGYRWRFFNALSVDGADSESSEDCAFCVRAGRAGHQTFVDHSVMPLHIGTRAYSYHNTRRQAFPGM